MSLAEIGEKSDALFCLTNSTNESSMVGEWYFPNMSKVSLKDFGSNIYITKGPSEVRLNRKNNTTMPNGVYRCDIPNANESIQSIYIGVYSNKGDGNYCVCAPHELIIYIISSYYTTTTFHLLGAVKIIELNFDEEEQALSCNSMGGPPTSVSWMKDDQLIIVDGRRYWQTQAIVNPNSSTYSTTLYIGLRDQDQVIGNYTCRIRNSRVNFYGNNQHIVLEIQGE